MNKHMCTQRAHVHTRKRSPVWAQVAVQKASLEQNTKVAEILRDELNKGKWEIADAWQTTHSVFFQGVRDGVGATGEPALPSDPAVRSVVLQWLMGLTTTADWLGSSEALCRRERLPSALLEPKEWSAQSMVLAAEAVRAAGLAPSPLPKARDGAAAVKLVLGEDRQPRPLQNAIGHAIDSLPSGSSLIVIEAPMGEGKTEAALSCALGTRGIYLAMPTQATSNALFRRLAEFLKATPAPDGTQRPITLSHSSGGPDSATLKLREIGLDTPDGSVGAGWWFRGGKRTLLCPHGIGTVDQGLLGVLQCRHSFLRLYGCR
jgi:CRISPR-associated endonuclease/helicase Cas3